MDTIGLDLHKRESQLCIVGEDGSVSERRIVTSRERFTAVLGNCPLSILRASAMRSSLPIRITHRCMQHVPEG